MAKASANGDGSAANGPDDDRDAAPATIGRLLRQAREASGMSLDVVSERTKVRPGILADIEADNHAALPALTYTLGFVKAFARTVGIDPQLAADRYRAESLKGEPVPTMVDLEPLEARRLPSRGLVTAMTVAIVLGLGLLTAWGAGWLTPEAPAPAPAPAAAGNAAPDPSGAGGSDPADDAEVPPAPAADAPVRLTANTEVWLRITDGPGGETLFMGTMAAGQTLDLPPGRPWQLRTGRAGALSASVGGQTLPPLGGPAEQVRDLLLTPEALRARASATAAGSSSAVNPTPSRNAASNPPALEP